jgi:hypothetical protein
MHHPPFCALAQSTLLRAVGLVAALLIWGAADQACGETFTFGSNANDLVGAASKTLVSGDFVMDLSAGPVGSGLWETGSALGMGVDSTAVLGGGGQSARFDRISGVSEFIEFSFSAPGMLTGLNFDGVKDESFEYFLLESAGGVRVNLFDSAANVTIAGAIDNAVLLGAVTGEVIYMLEGGGFDDETSSLAIPFAAGQVFRLTYLELGGGLGPQFEPTLEPNGARLQSITVTAVPEPTALAMVSIAAGLLLAAAARRRR